MRGMRIFSPLVAVLCFGVEALMGALNPQTFDAEESIPPPPQPQ